MSEATLSLHRTVTGGSHRTIPRNDDHKDGHLNIIATRHGWTRKLCINPEIVAGLDYPTLEAVLELNTLRLRPQHLRIFVETPPNSGQFSKIRYWKDDDALQSILVKQFFNQRMEEGTVTAIDIRDGHERDDTISIKSGISGSRFLPGSLSRPGETKTWLRRHMNRSDASLPAGLPTEEDGEAPPPKPKPSRTQALLYFLRLTDEPPAPPPKTEDQIIAEAQHEEETLRKNGWMPPVLKRMTSRKSKRESNKSGKTRIISSNPFFSSSERNLVRRRNKAGGSGSPNPDTGDNPSEELQMVDAEDGENPNQGKPAQKETRWLRFFSTKDQSNEENPFLGAKEKGKGKQKQTVQIVGKPSEAFDHAPLEEAD